MALQAFSFRRAAGAVARIRSVAPSVPAGAPGWATLIVRPSRHPLMNATAEGRSTVRQGLFSLRTPHRRAATCREGERRGRQSLRSVV
jgi:hypothetical protein